MNQRTLGRISRNLNALTENAIRRRPGTVTGTAPIMVSFDPDEDDQECVALNNQTLTVGDRVWVDFIGNAPGQILGVGTPPGETPGGVQPLNDTLSAISGLDATLYGLAMLELVDAAELRTFAELGTAATHDDGDYDDAGAAAAAQAASQPLDADLTAIAALTTTSFGRSLLEAADAAALRILSDAVGVIDQSAAGWTTPANTTENTLVTINIPANAMGANGLLRIKTLWTVNNTADDKTPRVRFSGASGTIYANPVITTSLSHYRETFIANRNATNSQVGAASNITGSLGSSGGAVTTSAVDTTAATTIVLTGQKETAGDTLVLESYCVELLRP